MRVGIRFSMLWLLAASALGAGSDKLQDALSALPSKDPSSYEKARDFLTKHPQEAGPRLLTLFKDDSQPPLVRLRVAKLLGDIADRQAIDDLKTTLLSGREGNAAVRVEIIRSLSKLGRTDIILAYLDSGRETSPSANAAIAMALQGSRDDKSKEALSRLLRSDDRRVFRAAAFAISKTYDLRNAPATKLESAASDRAVFEALKLRQTDTDSEISQTAAALLKKFAQIFKEL